MCIVVRKCESIQLYLHKNVYTYRMNNEYTQNCRKQNHLHYMDGRINGYFVFSLADTRCICIFECASI